MAVVIKRFISCSKMIHMAQLRSLFCNTLSLRNLSATCVKKSNSNATITSVKNNSSERMLQVTWVNGEHSLYPHLFLRDNCQCPVCFHPDTLSRLLNTTKAVDFEIKLSDVTHDIANNSVRITWPDQHCSVFPATWLQKRIFPKDWDSTEDCTGLKDYPPVAWKRNDIADSLPFVEYKEICESEMALFKHLENLLTFGLSIVRNAPKDKSVLVHLAKLMSYTIIRESSYG